MDYWDTAVEVNRLVCEPEKNWSDVSARMIFLFNAVLRQL